MMGLKINWKKLEKLKINLRALGLTDETQLIFIIILKDGTPRKISVLFKNLMQFCWKLAETKDTILTFAIQDSDGRILYRYLQLTNNEEIPNGGNADVIVRWPKLSREERDTYIRLLVSQINAYEK